MELNLVIVYFFEVRFSHVLYRDDTELQSKAHSFLAKFLCGFDISDIAKLIDIIQSKGFKTTKNDT